MRIATVDIGSYSCRLSVANLEDGKVNIIYEEGRITSLSSRVKDTGLIDDERMVETLEVLESFYKKAKDLGAERIIAVGTEVLRKARNAKDFINAAKERIGLDINVLTPEEEGKLAYLSAVYSLKPKGRILVVDQGGGSTEFVFGTGLEVEKVVSFPFGIVNLTEEFIEHDPPTNYELESLRNFLDEQINTVVSPVDVIIGLGGTITTIAALQHGIFPYDGDKVHGTTLSIQDIMHWLDTLISMKAQDRIKTFPHIEEKRATVIVPGILIFYRSMLLFGKRDILVSDWGLKEGLIIDQILKGSN